MKILIMTVTHRGGAGSNVLEVNAYYPYGMIMPALSLQNFTAPNYYKYNGKELQQELDLQWYDFGARMQDFSFSRWITPDPLAEKYFHLSTYAYAGNNPIQNIDPTGMYWDEVHLTEPQREIWRRTMQAAYQSSGLFLAMY